MMFFICLSLQTLLNVNPQNMITVVLKPLPTITPVTN